MLGDTRCFDTDAVASRLAGLVALALRPVTDADRATLFRWCNRPELIALSASGRAVGWDEHCACAGVSSAAHVSPGESARVDTG